VRVALAVLLAGLGIAAGAYLALGIKLGTTLIVPANAPIDIFDPYGVERTKVDALAPWQLPAGIAVVTVGVALAALVLFNRRRRA
jgi:hypothetical protein